MGKPSIVFAVLAPLVGIIGWHSTLQAKREPAPPVAAACGVVRPTGGEAGWAQAAERGRWRCVVIHHSATPVGGAMRFDKAHREQGWDELGYHFVIGNGTDTADGQVEVGGRWAAQKHGAHCRTDNEFYNEHGIGICLVGDLDKRPPTKAQQASLRRLVRFLCRAYDIPPARVLTHGGVTGKTRCPGELFDVKKLRAAVR